MLGTAINGKLAELYIKAKQQQKEEKDNHSSFHFLD